jgi:serine/threonine protein kinase
MQYYGLRHDVWGLGIVAYFLFAGHFPWDGETDVDICDAIIKEDLNIESLKDRKVDSKIIECINGMLLKDKNKRFTIRQVMSHKMFEAFHRQEKGVLDYY